MIQRRHVLCCSAALSAGLFTGLDARAGGWRNPCRAALPAELAQHPLLVQAFDDIDPAALWDVHAHLLGTGDSGSGCTVHASMQQWWHPVEVLRRKVPLIVHCGEEKAVTGADREAYGNPLRVRAALEAGVTVVVAHAASLGAALDLDRRSQPRRAAFDLWARLMDEPAWRGLLYADLS